MTWPFNRTDARTRLIVQAIIGMICLLRPQSARDSASRLQVTASAGAATVDGANPKGIRMLKLERLQRDSSGNFRLSNRHIVALCNLSSQVGLQGRHEIGQGGQVSIVTSTVRVDLAADPDAVVECADAGLAVMREGYVTVSRTVQEALAEWLDANAFPSG